VHGLHLREACDVPCASTYDVRWGGKVNIAHSFGMV
jgi:hypothetical protein